MTIHYLDTSAALKLLVEEDESEPLARWLNRSVPRSAGSVDDAGQVSWCGVLPVRW